MFDLSKFCSKQSGKVFDLRKFCSKQYEKVFDLGARFLRSPPCTSATQTRRRAPFCLTVICPYLKIKIKNLICLNSTSLPPRPGAMHLFIQNYTTIQLPFPMQFFSQILQHLIFFLYNAHLRVCALTQHRMMYTIFKTLLKLDRAMHKLRYY